jgi:hypothetical protein
MAVLQASIVLARRTGPLSLTGCVLPFVTDKLAAARLPATSRGNLSIIVNSLPASTMTRDSSPGPYFYKFEY